MASGREYSEEDKREAVKEYYLLRPHYNTIQDTLSKMNTCTIAHHQIAAWIELFPDINPDTITEDDVAIYRQSKLYNEVLTSSWRTYETNI